MLKQRHIIYTCAVLMDFGVAAILFAVTRRAAGGAAFSGAVGAGTESALLEVLGV